MPHKSKSTRIDPQSPAGRPRTRSTGAGDATTHHHLSSMSGSSQIAPIAAEEISRMRTTLDSMGYKQVIPNEPLTDEETLANMAIRLTQSYAAINAQVLAQAENISKLNRRIEQLNAQHLQDRTRWEAERFTSNRMTDALLAHARTDGGVKTEHLERECARTLADNFSLQNRLHEALARWRAAEEQLMMLHPYLLYGGDIAKARYNTTPTRVTPHYFSAAGLPYRSPVNVRSRRELTVPTTGPTGLALTASTFPDSHPSSALGGATTDSTAPRPKLEYSQAMSRTLITSTSSKNARTPKSPDSLDCLISAARKVLDAENSLNAPTAPLESCKAEESADSDEGVPATSALDVLVAAAFADHSNNEKEPVVDTTSGTEPPRRSQRNRNKRGPTVSRSTPFIGTEDKGIQAPLGEGRLPPQGRPRAPTNHSGADMKAETSARSPALPAFMNFTPDYKNVPSATTSSPAPAVAPTYPRSSLLPYYPPSISAPCAPAGTSSQINPLTPSSLSACARLTSSSNGLGLSIGEPPSELGSQSSRQRDLATAHRGYSILSLSITESKDPVKRQAKAKRTRQDLGRCPLSDRSVKPEKLQWACLSSPTGEGEEDRGVLTKRRRAQSPDGDSPTTDKPTPSNKSPLHLRTPRTIRTSKATFTTPIKPSAASPNRTPNHVPASARRGATPSPSHMTVIAA